ncbi:hypothetical protein [Parabacteroides sp. FAFU027]|uniref:hypothetical protein n=1 Tax=Parabacteroides sp. FAFU027 TaxID=2922715 RepID=UPI001FAF5A37|nr:hypothetical protein [Parabacteroides sp. FAFU027]
MNKEDKIALQAKIQSMTGQERKEHWRNQTLVNRVRDNSNIAVEYLTLINFIRNEYKGRIEPIQNPFLHLISHCIELTYKRTLQLAIECKCINIQISSIIHEHALSELLPITLSLFEKISQDNNCSEDDKLLYATEFPQAHKQLIAILKANVTTYRYAMKVNKKGVVTEKGHPFVDDYDSPNMLDVLKLFETCYNSLIYTDYILDFLFPELKAL